MKKLSVLLCSVPLLVSSVFADITYTLHINNASSTIQNEIKSYISQAVNHYNTVGSFNKHLNIYYDVNVPTANASSNGNLTFGGSRSTPTALHEIAHTLGVGTIGAWASNLSGGVWTGQYGAQQIQAFDGNGAKINGDKWHFWPYGINYVTEDSTVVRFRHVRMVASFLADMGYLSFTTEPKATTVNNGGTARFSVVAPGASSYAWYKTSSNSPLRNGGGISGATSSTLTISGVTSSRAGDYYCKASNSLVSRKAKLSVNGGDNNNTAATATMTSPSNGSRLTGSSQTFKWTATTGTYFLYVGTTAGGNQLFSQSANGTQKTVSNLPTNGTKIYVRLWTKINGKWKYNDYTYTAKSSGGGNTTKNYVKNEGFESGMASWKQWANASAGYVQGNNPKAGQKNLAHWSGSAYEVGTYQNITGVPNGMYRATVWAKSTGGQRYCKFYVNGFDAQNNEKSVAVAQSSNYKMLVINNIQVKNGKCSIAVYSNSAGGNWATFDNFTLIRQ